METKETFLVYLMDTKQKILAYSADKFMRFGLYKVSMDQLSREMRISKKTIYKYFKSKNELIEQAVQFKTQNVEKSVIEIIKSNQNSVEKINSFGQILFNLTKNVSETWFYDLKIHYIHIWDYLEKFRTRVIIENFIKIIEQGKSEGYIINKPTQIILAVIISSIRAVINPDFLLNNNFSSRNAAQITFNIIFNGIFTKQGRKINKKLKSEIV
ncbi:TetR/AcrR family transcriptional regulator [Bacteroidota bacterium]